MTKEETISELLKCLVKTPAVCSACHDIEAKGPLTSVPRDTMNKALTVLSHKCIVSKLYLSRLIRDVDLRVGDGSSSVIMCRQLLNDVAYCLRQERDQDGEPFLFSPNTEVAIEFAYDLRASDRDQVPIVVYSVNDDETKRCVFLDYQISNFTIETTSNAFEIIVDDRTYRFEFTEKSKHEYVYKGCEKKYENRQI